MKPISELVIRLNAALKPSPPFEWSTKAQLVPLVAFKKITSVPFRNEANTFLRHSDRDIQRIVRNERLKMSAGLESLKNQRWSTEIVVTPDQHCVSLHLKTYVYAWSRVTWQTGYFIASVTFINKYWIPQHANIPEYRKPRISPKAVFTQSFQNLCILTEHTLLSYTVYYMWSLSVTTDVIVTMDN